MTNSRTKSEQKFVTPVGRLLSDYISKPSTKYSADGTPEWFCKIAFPQSEKSKLKAIAVEAESLYRKVYKDAAKPPTFMPLIKDGTAYLESRLRQGKGCFEEFRNTYYLSVSSRFAPKFYGPTREEIDPGVFYCGCYVALKITPFVYCTGANEGCSAYIDGAQFVRHGEKLYTSNGGNPDGFEEFEEISMASKDDFGSIDDDDIPF